ncbi:MAG: hypothetical protein RR034_02630, partial [Bacteroidales bacterium]
FQHFSVRGYLIKEAQKRKMEINRDTFVSLANELRAQHSPSFIIDELYEQALLSKQNSIIESIRTPGEIDSLRKKGNFILLAVDANPNLRYHRITARNSETDHVSFLTFIENEQREMNSTDPNKQNLSKCIAAADYILENNGNFDELHAQIDHIVDKCGITNR